MRGKRNATRGTRSGGTTSPAVPGLTTRTTREAVIDQQRALLVTLEWVAGVCPSCGSLRDMGHHDGCPWVTVMGVTG